MNEKVQLYLTQLLFHISKIEEKVFSINSFSEYTSKQNEDNRLIIERCLITIGEAVNRIKKVELTNLLNNTKEIIGFRNLIVHSYDSVDDAIVWLIITKHLPLLKKEAENLLKNFE